MSQLSNLHGKINKKIFKSSGAKTLEGVIHCSSVPLTTRLENSNRSICSTQSDGSIIKNPESGLKQKLVNKVKSWSNKDKVSQNALPSTSNQPDLHITILSNTMEDLSLNNKEEEIFKVNDSLQSLLVAKTDKCNRFNFDSKTVPALKVNVSETQHYDSMVTLNSTTDTLVKQLAWDPWNKLGRKNKRDKRRKEKSPHTTSERSINSPTYRKGNDHTAGDEPEINTIESNLTVPRPQEPYKYHPYKSTRKSVDFVNEVAVMYFTGDEIISKAMEPLKKELDQQIRNKEMRRGHVPCTLLNKKEVCVDDYMSAWFKK